MESKLYQDYLKEYRGQEYLERDFGFITYRHVAATNSLFIQDIYVEPEWRSSGNAKLLIDDVEAKGRELGCVVLVGSVYVKNPHATNSLKCLLMNGGRIVSADTEKINLCKEL